MYNDIVPELIEDLQAFSKNNNDSMISNDGSMSKLEKRRHMESLGINPDKSPPADLVAERALLGAIIRNNDAYEEVSLIINRDDFYSSEHQKIFHHISELINKGHHVDHITLQKYFENDKEFIEICGKDYIVKLSFADTGLINFIEYARAVKDMSIRRSLMNLGEEIVNKSLSFNVDENVEHIIEEIEEKVYNISETGESERSFKNFGDVLKGVIERAEAAFKSDREIIGVTSGLKDLDKKLGGMHPSDLIILAGRPSMGKTALAMNIAFNAAKQLLIDPSENSCGVPVAFFSLEMSADQLTERLLSSECMIPSHKIRNGNLHEEDFGKFTESLRDLFGMGLIIDDTPGLSIATLRTKARRLKRLHNIGMIVVDYLQLLSGSNRKSSMDNRVNEISEITRGLKFIAKELSIPVLALSQLSRNVEARDDKRPQLSDLRESGSIEQDADVVMFIYRDEYYLSRSMPDPSSKKYEVWKDRCEKSKNIAEVIIAKQRHGPIGRVPLKFEGEFATFSDLEVEAKERYLAID